MSFDVFLGVLYLFIFGSFAGWLIEFCFRNIVHKPDKLINPGFLNGPYLPLYGTGVIILYLICSLDLHTIYKLLLIAASMTFIELVTGLFFIKYYNVKLWDYSNKKFNYKGVICPQYSFFWTVLGAAFYYLIYPYLHGEVLIILDSMIASFLLGAIYAVIVIDIIFSFDIVNKIKHELANIEKKVVVNYKELKKRDDNSKSKKLRRFLLNLEGIDVRKELEAYFNKDEKKD